MRIAIIIAIAILLSIVFFVPIKKPPVGTTDPEVAVIAARDVLSSEEVTVKGNTIVSYAYKAAPLPEKLDKDEIVGKRTPTSFTKDLGKTKTGDQKLQTIIYPEAQFFDDNGVWHQIEYATTTKAIFQEAKPVSYLFTEVAYATDFFATSGDGHVTCFLTDEDGAGTAFANCVAAATGNSADVGSDLISVVSSYQVDSFEPLSGSGSIFRLYIPFNTGAIPSGATISSATFNVYVHAAYDLGGYIVTVQTSQASNSTLVTSDYDNIGSTEGSDQLTVSGLTASAYNAFTLNATGLGWIKKSGQASNCGATAGFTCLGIRDYYDIANTPPCILFSCPGLGVPAFEEVDIRSSRNTGTSQDPYLSVNYSTGATFAPWQFQAF